MSTEVKFHRELYAGEQIDAALKALGKYARFEQAEEPQHWVVKVSCKTPERERAVAGELGNWALGLTLKARQKK